MPADKTGSGAVALLGEIHAKEQAELAALPTIAQLCLETPLYHKVDVTNKPYLCHLRRDAIQFDAFCTSCGRSLPSRQSVRLAAEAGCRTIQTGC
jgi:hypothetical protein